MQDIKFPSDYFQRCKIRSESETSAFAMLLYEMVFETKPSIIFEIGVNRGGISTHTFLKALDSLYTIDPSYRGKLFSIDIKDFSNTIAINNPIRKHWHFRKVDSRQFYKGWERTIDILFIDGGHRYEQVKSDYLHYEPFIRDGGYILMHDISESGSVMKFWNEGTILHSKIELCWQNGMGLINVNRNIRYEKCE